MTFLEKIKINIDYLLGKADPSLYAPKYKSPKIKHEEWQRRWEVFSDNGNGFVWYGFDSKGNIAEFSADETYIPEAFFQDVTLNKKLNDYFDKLPYFTNFSLPKNLRQEIRETAEKYWSDVKSNGMFVFDEANGKSWYEEGYFDKWKHTKRPYELCQIPNECLKLSDLPKDIQDLLSPYHFENLSFKDCQFLDVSKYLYCEE